MLQGSRIVSHAQQDITVHRLDNNSPQVNVILVTSASRFQYRTHQLKLIRLKLHHAGDRVLQVTIAQQEQHTRTSVPLEPSVQPRTWSLVLLALHVPQDHIAKPQASLHQQLYVTRATIVQQANMSQDPTPSDAHQAITVQKVQPRRLLVQPANTKQTSSHPSARVAKLDTTVSRERLHQ